VVRAGAGGLGAAAVWSAVGAQIPDCPASAGKAPTRSSPFPCRLRPNGPGRPIRCSGADAGVWTRNAGPLPAERARRLFGGMVWWIDALALAAGWWGWWERRNHATRKMGPQGCLRRSLKTLSLRFLGFSAGRNWSLAEPRDGALEEKVPKTAIWRSRIAGP